MQITRLKIELNEAEWHIYVSVNCTIIGSSEAMIVYNQLDPN